MTTEQEPFDFFDRGNITTGPQYLDTQYTEAPYDAAMMPQTIERAYVPSWDEPLYDESMPAAEPISEPAQREPNTPSWSYAENPLFAAMPADVKARIAYESTPFYENLNNQSAGDRLVQRIQEQTVETSDVHRSIYHQLHAEQSTGSVELMSQGFRATEAAPEPQPQPEQQIHAADLPISTTAYHEPVPLWGAPRRVSDDNIGLRRADMRGPLPDTLTPRLQPQLVSSVEEAPAPVVIEAPAYTEAIVEQPDTPPVLPGASSALLARLAEQAAPIAATPDNETTQVISTADLAKTVAKEQGISAGDQLATRVAAEATVETLETRSPKTMRSYGRELLKAAGFKFRMKHDKATESYYGEIVDSEGIVQVDKIKLDENAEGERMRTTRRLLGRMARLGMKIPTLPEPRIT